MSGLQYSLSVMPQAMLNYSLDMFASVASALIAGNIHSNNLTDIDFVINN